MLYQSVMLHELLTRVTHTERSLYAREADGRAACVSTIRIAQMTSPAQRVLLRGAIYYFQGARYVFTRDARCARDMFDASVTMRNKRCLHDVLDANFT